MADGLGTFDAAFVADPDGQLEAHRIEATDGDGSATVSYQVVRST